MITGKIETRDGKFAWLSIETDRDVVATVYLGNVNKKNIEIQPKSYAVCLQVPDAIYTVDRLVVLSPSGNIVYTKIPRKEV